MHNNPTYTDRWPDWRLAVLAAGYCLARTSELNLAEGLALEPMRGAFVDLVDRWGYLTSVTMVERVGRPGLIARALFPVTPHRRSGHDACVRLAWTIDVDSLGGRRVAEAWPRAWPEWLLTAPMRHKGHGRWRRYVDDLEGCVELVRWVLERAVEDPDARPVEAFPDPAPEPPRRQPRLPRPDFSTGRPSHIRRPITLANHYL